MIREIYEVEELIGQGAYGQVYSVRHKFLGIQALKLLEPAEDHATDPAELLGEARILAGLSDPHVVRVFDADVESIDGKPRAFFTMEYLPLGTLGDLLERRMRLGVDEALAVAIQMLSGLAAAHEHAPPVLHRDITPNNVLVSGLDPTEVKLSDFGLARHVDTDTRLLKAAGTIRYQPPEADWGFATEGSDLYAIGLILYEMLTGVAAFPLSSGADVATSQGVRAAFRKSRVSKLRPPSTFRSGLSPEVDAVLLAALAEEPMSRFRSASEFASALRQLAADL